MLEALQARRGRWSLSGLASMGAHGLLVVGWLLVSSRHPRASTGAVTEIELRPVPPAAVVPVAAPAPPAGGARSGTARPRRGLNLGPAAPVAVSFDDAGLVVPSVGVPDGDEDGTFDEPSPSTLRGPPGSGTGPGPGAGAEDARTIAPLEAAYLCTYQSLRGLPRALFARGRIYKLVVQMCIGADGRVEDVTLKKGAAPELDAQVVVDMRQWRYKPRIVHGKPTPFCYKVNVTYEVD